jgi:hypothetical protein
VIVLFQIWFADWTLTTTKIVTCLRAKNAQRWLLWRLVLLSDVTSFYAWKTFSPVTLLLLQFSWTKNTNCKFWDQQKRGNCMNSIQVDEWVQKWWLESWKSEKLNLRHGMLPC